MWHVAQVKLVDAIRAPILLGEADCQGPSLEALLREVSKAINFFHSCSRSKSPSACKGLVFAVVELTSWASLSSYEQHAEGAAGYLHVMKAYAAGVLSSGSGSPRTDTGTTPNDFSLN